MSLIIRIQNGLNILLNDGGKKSDTAIGLEPA